MKSIRPLIVASLALVLLFTCAIPAAFAKSKGAAPEEKTPLYDSVLAVNAKDGTIQIKFKAMKTTRVYKIDEMTAIKINVSNGKFGEIRPGMDITDLVERDSQTLDKITLQGLGIAPAAPEPKKAAKPKAAKPKPKTT